MTSTTRHIDSRQLIKELKVQGFELETTSDGYLVRNPKGQMFSFHTSSIDAPTGRSWHNVLAELRKIGYNPDKAEVKKEIKAARRREPGSFICIDPICGCGREFPYAQNLGRHLAAVRDRAVKEEDKERTTTETTKPVPPDDVRQLRKTIRQLRELSTGAAEIADLMERTLAENIDLKRKMKKVEYAFGKALDEL